jgi:hypothetical protein
MGTDGGTNSSRALRLMIPFWQPPSPGGLRWSWVVADDEPTASPRLPVLTV